MAAANTTFIVFNTAGTAVSAIQPNTLDGPGGVQQNSDLRMYGLGFPNWGEGVDENDYHLTENFACPALSTFPLSARYLLLGPVVAAKTPAGQAADELGPGNGINVPLVGQFWYNTTAQQMFCNTSTGWTATAGVSSVSAGVGVTLTGSGTSPTINIGQAVGPANTPSFAGGTMTGILTLSGNRITNLANPIASQDAATKQYVDSAVSGGGAGVYVPLAGGTMTGALVMTSAGITLNNGPGLTTNSTNVTVNSGTITVNSPSSGVAVHAGNGRISNVTTSALSDAMTATFGDARYLALIGGLLAGQLNMGGNKITNLGAPTATTDATTKQYVDAAVTTGSGKSTYNTISGVLPFTNGFIVIPGVIHNIIINFGFANSGTVTFSKPFTVGFFFGGCHTNRNSGGSSGYNHIYSPTTTTMGVLFDPTPNQGWWFSVGI